jgi:HTH-type transcriptional regulator / antitoxin HipB
MRLLTMQDLSAVIRGRRLELGLTQLALATRAGVSRDWLNQLEKGKTNVDLSLVLRLIEALGLRLDLISDGDAPSVEASDAVDLDAIIDSHRL